MLNSTITFGCEETHCWNLQEEQHPLELRLLDLRWYKICNQQHREKSLNCTRRWEGDNMWGSTKPANCDGFSFVAWLRSLRAKNMNTFCIGNKSFWSVRYWHEFMKMKVIMFSSFWWFEKMLRFNQPPFEFDRPRPRQHTSTGLLAFFVSPRILSLMRWTWLPWRLFLSLSNM